MVEAGTLCTNGNVVYKAGANVNATYSAEGYTNVYIKLAEGKICLDTRYDWVTNYASVSTIGKEILREAVSCYTAIDVINADPSGLPGGSNEALTKINVLWAKYIDIAEGTGIKLFYGMTTSAQTAIAAHTTQSVKYILSSETLGSDGETKTKSGATAADAEAFDLDFDLAPFNLPKKEKGTAYVTLNGTMTGGDPAVNHSACFKINVCKWNSTTSTETVLGT